MIWAVLAHSSELQFLSSHIPSHLTLLRSNSLHWWVRPGSPLIYVTWFYTFSITSCWAHDLIPHTAQFTSFCLSSRFLLFVPILVISPRYSYSKALSIVLSPPHSCFFQFALLCICPHPIPSCVEWQNLQSSRASLSRLPHPWSWVGSLPRSL